MELNISQLTQKRELREKAVTPVTLAITVAAVYLDWKLLSLVPKHPESIIPAMALVPSVCSLAYFTLHMLFLKDVQPSQIK